VCNNSLLDGEERRKFIGAKQGAEDMDCSDAGFWVSDLLLKFFIISDV